MAKAKKTILHDPRYQAFSARYFDNFPRYVLENSRHGLTWQQLDVAMAMTKPGCRVAIASGHGCFGIGTRVLMFDGSTKAVEDVVVNDVLMGDDWTPRNVLELARGRESLYRFNYDSGKCHVVNESHTMWLVNIEDNEPLEPKPLLVQHWLMQGLNGLIGKYAAVSCLGTLYHDITGVDRLGEGDYYGFKLDGNGRFLDADGIILQNTGKSFLLAWFLDWHLRTYPKSNALLTAPDIKQCRAVIWKYLDEVIEDMAKNWPWQAHHFIKMAEKYYVRGFKDSWYVLPKTASKARPETVAGQHNDNYLVVVDEASGVIDEVHGILRGALTHENNRYVMVSQPTRPIGHFAEAFSSLKNIYTTFNLNAEESPIVSKKFIAEKLEEYGGHHSPEYQIKVLGRLPDNLSGFLIPKSWLEISQNITINHTDSWGWVITIDVAEGVYRDSSVFTIAKVSGHGPDRKVEIVEQVEYLDKNELEFAREIHVRLQEYPNITIAVDADGAGRTVILTLEELGHSCERIHWGLPPHTDADKKRYKNQRAFASVKAREGLFAERLKLPGGKKIVEQGAKIPYKIDDKGRYTIMPKDQMKSEGIKSPDLFDTVCFFYLVDYIPVGDVQTAGQHDEFLRMAEAILSGEAA